MAFSLRAVLGMDAKPFERGMNRAKRKVNRAAKSMMASLAPILGFVGFTRLATSAVQLGSRLSDLAKQVDTDVEAFQVLDFAAKDAGASQETLTRALRNLKDRGMGAADGMKSYAKAFEALNINVEEFNQLPQEQKMVAVADAAKAAKEKGLDPYATVMDIMGERSGPELQEVLERLADQGFDGIAKSAEDSGQIMDRELIAKMDSMSDKVERSKRRFTILSGEIMIRAVPAFSILGQGLGFVADYVGSSIAIWLQFGKSLGRVITAVVQPGITAFKSLGSAAAGAAKAASGDVMGAKKALAESGRLAKQVAADMKNIPSEMATAGKNAAQEVSSALSVMGDSLETRNASIVASFNEIKNAGKDTSESVKSDFGGGVTFSKSGASGSGETDTMGGGLEISADERALRKFRLDALKAEVRGEEDVAKAMRNRVKMIERVQKIMRDTNATREEALIIARRQIEAEIKAGEESSKSAKKRKSGGSEFGRELKMSEATALTEGDREAARALVMRSRLEEDQAGRGNKPADISEKRSRANKNEVADPIVKATHEVRDEVKKLRTEEV